MHIHIILVLLPEMDTDNVLQYRAILYKWSNGKKVYFNFSIPVLWREQSNHQTDCYFCLTKVVGINMKNGQV